MWNCGYHNEKVAVCDVCDAQRSRNDGMPRNRKNVNSKKSKMVIKFGRRICCDILYCIGIAILLLVFDQSRFSPNVYIRETSCEITNYHQTRNHECDHHDLYDHHIEFKQTCNGKIYHIKDYKTCSGAHASNHLEGEIYRCWTNENCSIQALFNDNVVLWFLNIISILGYLFLVFALNFMVDFVSWSRRIYQYNPHLCYNTLSEIVFGVSCVK